MNCYERTDGHTVHSYNPSPLHGGGYNREVLYLDINGYKQVFYYLIVIVFAWNRIAYLKDYTFL